MDWKNYWEEAGKSNDPFRQVERIRNNNPLNDKQILLIIERIQSLLQIKITDEVLDVCCGNGLLTKKISGYCKHITGVDFSETLIHSAVKHHSSDLITFECQDALTFQTEKKFDKAFLYFSFQYFDTFRKGELLLLHIMLNLKPGGKLLLGDIPDKSKEIVYYRTTLHLLISKFRLMMGVNVMGKFWDISELDHICESHGWKGTKLIQSAELPYSDYRFDYLIEKD